MTILMNKAKYFGKDGIGEYVTSNWIANVTGKQHRHVTSDIDKYYSVLGECPNLDARCYYRQSSYKTVQGKSVRNYRCYVKGCEMYANKMTGKKGIIFSARYINKFHEMKKSIMLDRTPKTYPDALIAYAKQLKQTKEEAKLANKYKSDSDKLHRFLHSMGTSTITDVADRFSDLSSVKANRVLHGAGVQYRTGRHWHLYTGFVQKHPKLATIKTTIVTGKYGWKRGRTFSRYQLVWTNMGTIWLCQFFLKHHFHLIADVPQPAIDGFLQKTIA